MGMLRSGRDEQSVDIEDRDERLYWLSQFNVSEEQLRQAIDAVGNRADHLRDYIERCFTDEVRDNTAR